MNEVKVTEHDLLSFINPSSLIGAQVMDTLKEVDLVAYVRFASVYRDFREARDFEAFLGEMEEPRTPE